MKKLCAGHIQHIGVAKGFNYVCPHRITCPLYCINIDSRELKDDEIVYQRVVMDSHELRELISDGKCRTKDQSLGEENGSII